MSDEPSIHPAAGHKGRKRRRRPPPRVSRADFERAALRHLERYPSSVAGLRAVLERRAQRSFAHHGEGLNEAEAIIPDVVERMQAYGFLDDRRYGEALIRRLRARGNSLRRIAIRLHERGVASDVREALLADAGEAVAELEAARTYARRRRFGVHRRPDRYATADAGEDGDAEEDRRRRELASLARAGFAFETARRALEEEA